MMIIFYLVLHPRATVGWKQIIHVLKKITEHPEMIEQYREKAWKCGYQNHEKVRQQRQLLEQLEMIAEEM